MPRFRTNSFRMPTARCVLPVPISPMISRPLLLSRIAVPHERGCKEVGLGKRRVSAWKVGLIVREVAVFVSFRECAPQPARFRARARSWQSQRVTRRSLGAPVRAGSVFHPVPSQSGQTSACVLISIRLDYVNPSGIVFSDFAPARRFPQVRNARRLCTTCEGLWRAEENRSRRTFRLPLSVAACF